MPIDHTKPPKRGDIYQQIIVTLPDEGSWQSRRSNLSKALGGVDHEIIGSIEEISAVLVQFGPHEDVARVSSRLVDMGVAVAAEQNRPLYPSAVVNDPGYPQQWALSKIGAETAWLRARRVVNTSAPGVIVAVIDTGIDTQHPDLAGHIWNDGAGNEGFNLIAWNYDISDTEGHGTELAGTIGAVSNNTRGIAAAEWPVRLMAIKFIDVANRPTAWTGAVAITWAALQGAQIINAAWGVGIPYVFLRNAIRFAKQRGILVVAAAGNDGLDNDALRTYPASYGADPADDCPNLISVMASDRNDDKAWFSNYGRTYVHLAAPGVGVLTTASSFGEIPTTAASHDRYRAYTGTSAACALVTNAAVLVKTMNPGWTPEEIRNHLIASADFSPWLKCVARGRLNLDRAVRGPFMITSPIAGDQWTIASTAVVTWTNSYVTGRPTTSVTLELSADGAPYAAIATLRPNSGSCTVVTPNNPVGIAMLRIRSDQGPKLFAESDPFKIA